MVSNCPATQSYNFTHMWDFTDLRGPTPKDNYCPNSLMEIINNHSNFSKFRHMVKLAKLDGVLAGAQADFTLFVPSDNAFRGINDAVFMNMDDATARHIVKSSMLDRKLSSDVIKDSPASYFITKDPPNRLFISNISGKTYINNDINVIHFDQMAKNGIIHVIDKLIWPEML